MSSNFFFSRDGPFTLIIIPENIGFSIKLINQYQVNNNEKLNKDDVNHSVRTNFQCRISKP